MHVATVIAALLLLASVVAGIRARRERNAMRGRGALRRGATRLYTRRNALHWVGAAGGAAVLVYSGADEAFERWHTREVPSRRTRGFAEEFKQFGEPYWVGVWATLAVVDHVLARTAVSRFGRRCLEASVIGLPVLWSTQRLLGSSRPSDDNGPGYRPFHDENAASGHTFIAAVPLLVLARDHNPAWLRAAAGALSPVTGWTRLHDRKHYLSQVLLGWTIAWKAAGAVLDGEKATGSPGEDSPST